MKKEPVMSMGLLFLGHAAANADQAKREAKQHDKERRDRALHGLSKQGVLSDEDRILLLDIQKQITGDQVCLSTRCCPECHRQFALVRMRDVTVDYCTHCRGCWFDPGELGLVAGTGHDIPAIHTQHRKSKYACPQCGIAMWESVYKKPLTLLVDRCPDNHGVYLEQGELERVLRAP